MKALVVLTPTESKRLISKGLAQFPQVKTCLERGGRIFISRGTTDAYVLEELSKTPIEKPRFVAGQVTSVNVRRLGGTPPEKRLAEKMLEEGEWKDADSTAITRMQRGDVIIKGANALDANFMAAVYMSHPEGGTIGRFLGTAKARGLNIIIPVGLEKLVADSVWDSSFELGQLDLDLVMGSPIGMMPIPGEPFTEVDALETLFPDILVSHVGSGGVGGAEGSVTLLLEGDEASVRAAFELAESLTKETPFRPLT
jgi:hypothetical protein